MSSISKMDRRWIVFGFILVLIWCPAILKEDTRQYLKSALHPETKSELNFAFFPEGQARVEAKREAEDNRNTYASLLKEHPRNPDIQFLLNTFQNELDVLEGRASEWQPASSDLRVLASLLNQHAKLRGNLRFDGPFSNPGWPTRDLRAELAVDSKSRRHGLALIPVANLGARLDPKNAFWKWNLACALLELRRDQEAKAALREAKRKLFYRNYSESIPLLELRVMSLDKTPTLEEFKRWFKDRSPFWTDPVDSNGAYRFMELAYLSQKSGDLHTSVEISESVLRVAQKMEKGTQSLPTVYRSTRMTALALTQWQPMAVRKLSLSSPDNLAYFANQIGSVQLAQEVLKLKPRQNYRQLSKISDPAWTGVAVYQYPLTHWFNSAIRWFVASLLFLAGLWIFSAAMVYLTRNIPDETKSLNTVPVVAAGVSATFLLIGDSSFWDYRAVIDDGGINGDTFNFAPLLVRSLPAFLILFSSIAMSTSHLRKSRDQETTNTLAPKLGYSPQSPSAAALKVVPIVARLTVWLFIPTLIWLYSSIDLPESWNSSLDLLRRQSKDQVAIWLLAALILLQFRYWLRNPHWKSALAQTFVILVQAIPLYLATMLLIFGLGLFPITAISNDGVQKFTAALNRGEVTCRREALARQIKSTP